MEEKTAQIQIVDPTASVGGDPAEILARQFLIRDDVVFLNHGSFGACPRPVFEVYQGWQLKLERQPVAFLDPARGLNGWMRDAREALAGELGTHADNIVGVTSATVGLNIIARSLKLKPGDEILTTDHEYAALEKTWTFVAMRTGARIVTVKVPMPLTTERGFTEAVLKGITDRTRVVFLSHITSPTALVFPIEAVIAEARRRGIFTVIDGAHTLGHIDLDLDGLGVDFYAGNCHKWLMAPKGSAFLFVRPEIQNLIDPLVISHGWTAQSKAAGAKGAFGNSPFIDGLEMQGTRDPAAWLSVPDAIAFRRGHIWPDVARRCAELARSTASRLATRTGLAPLSSPEFSAPQMVAMPIPRCDPMALKKVLMDNYSIEIPVFDWQGTTIVRLSVQGYNTPGECALLLEALGNLLKL